MSAFRKDSLGLATGRKSSISKTNSLEDMKMEEAEPKNNSLFDAKDLHD